jgi:chromosome segregation ATPase
MAELSIRVPFMDLETRVAALETDFAALHTSNNSQHHDMRVEYRGWAEHAVHAHEKLNTAKEMMHLILTDVREIKETHGRKLDDLSTTVNEHTQILGGHTRKLDDLSTTVNEHTQILGEHTRKLDDLSTTVNGHTLVLGEHTQKLDEHGTLLREILAKVS